MNLEVSRHYPDTSRGAKIYLQSIVYSLKERSPFVNSTLQRGHGWEIGVLAGTLNVVSVGSFE